MTSDALGQRPNSVDTYLVAEPCFFFAIRKPDVLILKFRMLLSCSVSFPVGPFARSGVCLKHDVVRSAMPFTITRF